MKAKIEKHWTRARVYAYIIHKNHSATTKHRVRTADRALAFGDERFGGRNGFLDGVHFHTPNFNNNGTPYAK